jgi:predicted ATPase
VWYSFAVKMNISYLIGPPCSGKTLLLKELSRYEYHTYPEFLDSLPPEIKRAFGESVEDNVHNQRWVVDQHQKKNLLIANDISEGKDHVAIDRTVIDALAYSSYLGREVLNDTLSYASKMSWVPGVLFYVCADHSIIRERFINREKLSESEWSQDWESFITGITQEYNNIVEIAAKHFPHAVVYLDSSTKTVNSLVKSVISHWESTSNDKGISLVDFRKLHTKLREHLV